MRLLFVSEFLPRWNSGAEGSLLSIGEALEKRGHKVRYLWKDPAPGVLPHHRLYDLFELPARQLDRVDKTLQSADYDVVILSQPYSYLVYEKLARRYPGTLFLNRTHGWEDRMGESWRQLGWRNPSPIERPLVDLSARLMRSACERTARACQGIITASELCARYIKSHYRADGTQVSVIPYGVEPHLFRPRNDISQQTQRLLFVGQYLPRKGSHVLENTLPAVAARYPKASVTFVVPESCAQEVERIYRCSFGARLSILPWTTREKLAEIYSRHDLLLFPSYFEGFGKVFLEAMAAGLCVVGFREGGLPDVAQHSREALMCETGDSHAFRILTECALSDSLWVREIGGRAREAALRYTWERHAIETERFCDSLRFGQVKAPVSHLIGAA